RVPTYAGVLWTLGAICAPGAWHCGPAAQPPTLSYATLSGIRDVLAPGAGARHLGTVMSDARCRCGERRERGHGSNGRHADRVLPECRDQGDMIRRFWQLAQLAFQSDGGTARCQRRRHQDVVNTKTEIALERQGAVIPPAIQPPFLAMQTEGIA